MRWCLTFLVSIAICLEITQAAPLLERNKFVLYYGRDSSEVFPLSNAVDILSSPNFDQSKKTVIYIHGNNEDQTSVSVKTVVSAYLQRDDYNIIALDWKEDASGEYLLNAVANVMRLGDTLSKVIADMIAAGLNRDRLHLVGYSLGGQMVGRIGAGLKRRSSRKLVLRRITALDPSFTGFYGPFTSHITKDDAQFVDIIHTDAYLYGFPENAGTVDFWPNGGNSVQPGCPRRNYIPMTENDLCSSWRSWRYWAESVARPTVQFNAIQAANWGAFKKGNVAEYDQNVVMGNDCPENISGVYYLQTNSESPFARGEKGVNYNRNNGNSVDENELED
ncbi:unnamed protein product [Hermetia illucens]|uniref:Lipase domain-containing protein n=1 Tax=Hermetia illucens TaxID=343691 RepID=A0A7R8UEU3_HERIL|nr:pancreatic triacylglycerol lipase-like [Hermetia illucens]CAD7079407.1 unnamed protein product [Hermetia illucens]